MYYYIVNPSAGGGRVNQVQDKLRAKLEQLGVLGEFAKTTGPGDATKMAAAAIAKGATTIVAVGGDGTVNEVVNGITRDEVAVGIIPIGHTNFLANRLGIFNWQQAAEVLAARRLTGFGLIAAGQKFFLSTLSLGFETDMEKQTDSQKNLKSTVRQLGQSWGQGRSFTPLTCHIQVDDKFELDCDIFSLSAANQKFENPLLDNKLIITLRDKPSRTQLTTYLFRKLRGREALEDSATTRFKADRVVIKTNPSTGIMVDGKIAGRTPIAIRLTDRRIRFITEKTPTGLKDE